MMLIKTGLIVGLGTAVLLASNSLPSEATAGGLFGPGGLIRGDVGNFLDENVEKPVSTPVARGAVVAGGAAAGAAIAPAVGVPPGVGAAIGAAAGNEVNNIAAGKPTGQ